MSQKDSVRAWWAGFFVLAFSMVMLALCTFLEVRNPTIIEIWKSTFFASIGYVVGHSLGIFGNESSYHKQS